MLQRLLNSVQASSAVQAKETVLRPGQVVQGTIMEKLPGDMAVVQINNTKMLAKIEAPLEENGRYVLQVKQSENGQLVLKVMQPGNTLSMDERVSLLLKQVGVSGTLEMKQLATMLLNNNIPLTQAKLQQLANVLAKMPLGEEELQAIRLLIQKDLPLTETTIKSVTTYEKNPSLQQGITNVLSALMNEEELPKAAGQLKEFLTTTYQGKQQDALIRLLTEGIVGKENRVVESLLQKMNISNTKVPVEQVNVSNGTLPMAEVSRNEQVKNMTPEQFISFVKELPSKQEQVHQLLSYFSKDTLPSTAVQQFAMLSEKMPQLTKQEQQVLTKVMNDVFAMPAGKELASHMKMVIESLGLEWEQSLTGRQQKQEHMNTLKPLLLQTLEEPLTSQTKSQIEVLVHRITGQQLLSQETVGPMLHVVTHIPMTMAGVLRDVQIEWSGKETKDGQIDTDFCRIFFYLQLEALQDTGIDVHIQNRIVQITVLNNTDGLERIIPMYQESLRQHLQGLNYELSAIKVRPFGEEKVERIQGQSYYSKTYSGVDLHV
ncbi:hypothetical protein [Priestia taiwanensis]|uniref:Flagellar hook-length control protein FliK n=1 Tax=Priestia taiwanensis TaxID=1347902 RepID=A0A917EN88_9BACI|nr:hypothetical protein [Priestia taiwanensis]MBM7362858.1 hypothetical protein [Priestia taiwanensis]GGE65731.1 hypothetical protein GCM10007140_14820 [Priestia taiwanensis]